MAILHGSWLWQQQSSCLFIWGEIWRSPAKRSLEQKKETSQLADLPDGIAAHPLVMTQVELISFLGSHGLKFEQFVQVVEGKKGAALKVSERWTKQVVSLPTYPDQGDAPAHPVPSFKMPSDTVDTPTIELQLWEVAGLYLEPLEAVKLLQAIPLGSLTGSDAYLGGDLRFWSQVYRWSLDLIARCKFLPTISRQSEGEIASHWQPLLDSAVDRSRLDKFARQMPAACQVWGLEIGDWEELDSLTQNSGQPRGDCPYKTQNSPQELLLGFLSSTIDAQVRTWANANSLPKFTDPLLRDWLPTLSTSINTCKTTTESAERLEKALRTWIAPVQDHLVVLSLTDGRSSIVERNLFRVCFLLLPPATEATNWTLQYYLQAAEEFDFLVDAATIWKHPVDRLVYRGRSIDYPQETFLKGLGLASRLYPPIEPSLHKSRPQSCVLTPDLAYEFVKSSAWRLQDSGLGVILPPSLTPDNSGNRRLGLKIRADVGSKKLQLGLQSLLKFKFELAIGDQSLSEAEFKRLLALQTPLVEINGEWIALQRQDIRAAEAVLATPKDQLSLSLEDAVRLSTGDNKTIAKLPVVSFEASGVLQELVTNLTDNKSIQTIALPASFQGELRPYQARGVAWLAFLERWGLGACLADDMGLGKTPQTIAFLLHLQEQDRPKNPTLIICPTSVLGNWEREVKKFAPTLKTSIHHGDKRLKNQNFAKAVASKNIVITSYSLAYRDLKTLQAISWQGVVLDEAQNVKNSESKQAQAVRQLNAEFRISLTGTPVENRLSELWSILDFLNPGYLGTRQFFQRRFAIPIEKYGDTDSLRTLRSLVQPFILRRLKTDREIIQDLPEKQEMSVFCGLSAEQATMYEKVVEQSLAEIEAADGIQRRGMILSLLVKLKQVCNHPAHFLKEKHLESLHRSGKLQRLEEMLEEVIAEGDRALIFTQFAEWGKLLQPYLKEKLGWETLFLYGGVRQQQREEMIDRFQNDPQGPPILILSLKAGGTGLNLTRANHVFHFDRWWNPAVENQATDRAFRIGQTRNVQVHKFICTGTLEERINEIIESKKNLAEQTVGAGEQWLTEMNTNQLRNLLLLDRSAIIDEEE